MARMHDMEHWCTVHDRRVHQFDKCTEFRPLGQYEATACDYCRFADYRRKRVDEAVQGEAKELLAKTKLGWSVKVDSTVLARILEELLFLQEVAK